MAARRDQEGFLQALGRLNITAERASELWLSFLRERTTSECNGVNVAIKAGDTNQARLLQGEVRSTLQARQDSGEEGTDHQRQLDALRLMGEGLNQQQREDMMRGAIGAGFSAGAVFAYQDLMNQQERQRRAPQDVSDELALANDNLNLYIRDQTIQRIQQLRAAQGSYEDQVRLNGEASPQVRQRRDEEAARLARLLGANPTTAIKEAESGNTDTMIATSWTNGLMNYHMHNLAGTIPVRMQ